jgi:hypothetical protein
MGNKSSTPVPPSCTITLTGEELYNLAVTAEENKKAQLDREANNIVKRLIPLAYKGIENGAKKGLTKGTITVDLNTDQFNKNFKEIKDIISSKIKYHFKQVYNISINVYGYLFTHYKRYNYKYKTDFLDASNRGLTTIFYDITFILPESQEI